MKTLAATTLLLLSCFLLRAQCPQGNVILITQSLVDAFGEDWPECRTIPGNVILGFEHGTATVTDLSPLANIERIEGSLSIRQQDFLTSLHGLGNLKYIGGDFELIENYLLPDMRGLDQLDTIGGRLIMQFNRELTTLRGLESLRYAQDFWAVDNDQLLNLDGLDQFLPDSSIVILYNIALSDISGLERFAEFGGFLSIGGSEALKEIQILEGIDSLQILSLSNLPMLESLEGLEKLVHAGEVHIGGNNSLKNLEALSALKSIQSALYIKYNESLTSLKGLENLSSIGASVRIDDNPLLTDISALDHFIAFGGTSLVVKNNRALSNCSVQALCEWLTEQEIENLDIGNNGDGCQSEEAIEAACPEDGLYEIRLSLSPNPFRNILNVQVGTAKEINIRFWDAAGRLLLKDTFTYQHEFDLHAFSPGLYFVELEIDSQRFVRKVVKI